MAKGKVGLGRQGETLAAAALTPHGFAVRRRNWYCAEGEADLIAQRAGEWYFFEVRTRREAGFGSPEESVTPRKRARMEAVARRYLAEQTAEEDAVWHLGLVAVVLDRAGRVRRVTVYPDLDSEPWEVQG